jgi:alkanesulfonate monooxygenase SsuD/methylene tetrahydromethanopterin reductase-like flavin-dependent oxidoreductase (luciferase family)
MAVIELGLFDIQQLDPLAEESDADFYATRLADLARADELGLDVAFVAERHYLSTYRCQASSVWLGAASQRTRAMRLGVLAHTLPITPPARLAEEIAVLDQLTGGRTEVGLGLGHRAEELVANGIDPNDRIAIFQERLAIMEGLWAGGSVTYSSAHTTVQDVYINPKPVQTPHPPIWFAGTEPNSALWAGQHGLNLAIGFAPSDVLFGATASFRNGVGMRKQRGPESDTIRRGAIALMRQTIVGESDERVRDEMLDALLRLGEIGIDATDANRPDRKQASIDQYDRLIGEEIVVAGSPETVARAILDARNKLGSSVYLANVYAAGLSSESVGQSITLLAGSVREALDSLTSRIIPVEE